MAASIDLSVDEVHCLFVLFYDHPASVKRLSELITVGSTRASKILRDLEVRGHLSRSIDATDHRKEHVILTESGEKLVHRIIALYENVGSELLLKWRNEFTSDFSWLRKTTTEQKSGKPSEQSSQ